MGTSSSYGGPRGSTPLVPTWLEEPGTGTDSDNTGNDQDNSNESNTDGNATDTGTADAGRYTSARSNLTRFAKSGGSDRRSLGRAMSSYVSRSSGGSRQASRKMGSSKRTTVGLISFLQAVRERGSEAALANFDLRGLAGRPIEEIFLGLADRLCPDGGNVDQGIARNAFIETIAKLTENGITDLNSLTPEQLQLTIELFVTHAIEGRICNDIGSRICSAPADIATAERVQEQLHDFILRSVSDALNAAQSELTQVTTSRVSKFVDRIYEQAFDILQALADQESESS